MTNLLEQKLSLFFSNPISELKVYLIFREIDDDTNEYIYSSSYFGLGNKDFPKFIEEYRDKLVSNSKNKEITDYNVSVTEKGSIEKINASDVPNLKKIVNVISPLASENISKRKFEPIEIWGYVVDIKNTNEEKIKTFRKFIGAKTIKENKIMKLLGDNVEFTDPKNLLIVDFKIDSILIDDNCYIFNEYYFNTFFSFKEEHIKYINTNIGDLKKQNIINNFDEFHARCINSTTLVKRLVPVIKDKRLQWLQNNFKQAKTVAQEYNLKIEFEENKINYSDKTCNITDVISLICGCCVKDAVDMEMYIASSVRKVNRKITS